MTFTPEIIPDPDQAALKDSQGQFDNDVPWSVKQAATSMRRHRWFAIVEIGANTGPYSIAPGLPAGQKQRIQFDHKPDFIIVGVSGDTATTGRLSVFLGDEGGPGIRLGQTGKVIVPGPQAGVITLVARGTTAVYGTVIAVAGYDVPLDYQPGL